MGLAAVEVEIKHLDRRLEETNESLEKLGDRVEVLDVKIDEVLLKLARMQPPDGGGPKWLTPAVTRTLVAVLGAALVYAAQALGLPAPPAAVPISEPSGD